MGFHKADMFDNQWLYKKGSHQVQAFPTPQMVTPLSAQRTNIWKESTICQRSRKVRKPAISIHHNLSATPQTNENQNTTHIQVRITNK